MPLEVTTWQANFENTDQNTFKTPSAPDLNIQRVQDCINKTCHKERERDREREREREEAGERECGACPLPTLTSEKTVAVGKDVSHIVVHLVPPCTIIFVMYNLNGRNLRVRARLFRSYRRNERVIVLPEAA